jgi:hypothetical protein
MKCFGQHFKLRRNREWVILHKKKRHEDVFWEMTVVLEEPAASSALKIESPNSFEK